MPNGFPKDTSKFKLIVSDFDGTLAGANHIVSKKVEDAVEKWTSAGKFFSIATGRQYLMIEDECKKMGLKDPVVVRAGAEVVDPKSGEVLNSEFIEKEDVGKILEFVEKSNTFLISIEIDNYIYSNFKLEIEFPKIKFLSLPEFKIRRIHKIHLRPKNDLHVEQEDLIKGFIQNIPSIHAIATHNNTFGRGWDITSTKATKLHGIVKLMEILSIERKDIVGVGDSYNDFPLLEAAGFKVAMGNANDELKEIADVIIPSNEEDGVAYLIDNLLK
jgi:hypothetical protein